MNWDAIGAIAEMLGATAILVTLVYLAVQIKYAHLTSTDTNRSNRVVGIRELNSNLVIDRVELPQRIFPQARLAAITDVLDGLSGDADVAGVVDLLAGILLPLPVLLHALLVSAIQTLVVVWLSMIYIGRAVADAHADEQHVEAHG